MKINITQSAQVKYDNDMISTCIWKNREVYNARYTNINALALMKSRDSSSEECVEVCF